MRRIGRLISASSAVEKQTNSTFKKLSRRYAGLPFYLSRARQFDYHHLAFSCLDDIPALIAQIEHNVVDLEIRSIYLPFNFFVGNRDRDFAARAQHNDGDAWSYFPNTLDLIQRERHGMKSTGVVKGCHHADEPITVKRYNITARQKDMRTIDTWLKRHGHGRDRSAFLIASALEKIRHESRTARVKR